MLSRGVRTQQVGREAPGSPQQMLDTAESAKTLATVTASPAEADVPGIRNSAERWDEEIERPKGRP